jgi:hypothetical protein
MTKQAKSSHTLFFTRKHADRVQKDIIGLYGHRYIPVAPKYDKTTSISDVHRRKQLAVTKHQPKHTSTSSDDIILDNSVQEMP